MKLTIILVAALIIGAISVAGCTSSTNSNQSGTTEGMTFAATPFVNPPQTPYGLKPGDEYVAFNCTVKDVSASPTQKYISSGYWNLVDQNGNIYYPVIDQLVNGTPGVTLFGTHYASPGQVESGSVFFEVPANHAAWNYLYYEDGAARVELSLS